MKVNHLKFRQGEADIQMFLENWQSWAPTIAYGALPALWPGILRME